MKTFSPLIILVIIILQLLPGRTSGKENKVSILICYPQTTIVEKNIKAKFEKYLTLEKKLTQYGIENHFGEFYPLYKTGDNHPINKQANIDSLDYAVIFSNYFINGLQLAGSYNITCYPQKDSKFIDSFNQEHDYVINISNIRWDLDRLGKIVLSCNVSLYDTHTQKTLLSQQITQKQNGDELTRQWGIWGSRKDVFDCVTKEWLQHATGAVYRLIKSSALTRAGD